MNISDIKIRKTMTEGRLRAIVSITLEDTLAVHDIKIVQGDERMFVAMPSRKVKTEYSVISYTLFPLLHVSLWKTRF